MSRAKKPKHLLKLLTDRTLLEETLRRVEGVVPPANIRILTSKEQLAGVREALPFLPAAQIVAEPARRDTAPAAALATGMMRARDPKAVVALLAADAHVKNSAKFASQLSEAFGLAEKSTALFTVGIKPSHASTGFGYLELGERLGRASASVVRRVRRFVEKPDGATARKYLEDGNHVWNASIFIWRADSFLAVAEKHAPELAAFVRDFPKGDFSRYVADRFPQLPKISVDYAIMEKAPDVATVIAEFDWDDVGTWSALSSHIPADAEGNTLKGPVVAVGASNTIAVSNGRLIALCGVKDLVVVETPDAVLVCHRDAVQDVKRLQPLLPKDLR